MKEAIQAFTNYAFDILKGKRIEIRIDEDNIKSRQAAERSGYTLEAILKANQIKTNGSAQNTCIYSRLSAENFVVACGSAKGAEKRY